MSINKRILFITLFVCTAIKGFAYEEELMQILNKIEKCRATEDYRQELALVKSLDEAISYNDLVLMFIPKPEQKAEYERAEKLSKLKETVAYNQYKAMFDLLEYQAKKHLNDSEMNLPLYRDRKISSGYFKDVYEGYRELWQYSDKSSTAYRQKCIILALSSLERALTKKFDVVQDPIMKKMQALTGFCFSEECLKQQVKECRQVVFQIKIPQEADAILYLYRFKSDSDKDLKPIAEALHRIGYNKGTFLLGNYYLARRDPDHALIYLEECKKKGDVNGTLLYAQALFFKYKYEPQQRKLMYEAVIPYLENENFDKYGAYVYATLLEKGDCCPADTAAALDYYIRSYERATYNTIRDAAYEAHRKLFDAYEATEATEVISTDTDTNTRSISGKKRTELAQYYAELNDANSMLDILTQGIKQKDDACMVFLGEQYYEGKLLKQDYEEAVYYTQMALDTNPKNMEALNNMALFLTLGYGIFPDIDLALKYIDQSIANGNDKDGPALKQGIIDRNHSAKLKENAAYHEKRHADKKAFYFYNRAAAKGDLAACYKVALAYLKGTGIEQDRQKGIEYLKKALPYAKAATKLKELGE